MTFRTNLCAHSVICDLAAPPRDEMQYVSKVGQSAKPVLLKMALSITCLKLLKNIRELPYLYRKTLHVFVKGETIINNYLIKYLMFLTFSALGQVHVMLLGFLYVCIFNL